MSGQDLPVSPSVICFMYHLKHVFYVQVSHTFKVDELTSLPMFRDAKLECLFGSVSNKLSFKQSSV